MVSSGSKTSIIHVNLTRQLICHHFRMEIYMHSHKSLNINSVQDDTTVMLSHIQCRVVQWSGFCRVLVQRVMIPCWDHWGMDTYKSSPTGVWLMWLWVVGVTHSCGFRYPQPLPTPMTISQTHSILVPHQKFSILQLISFRVPTLWCIDLTVSTCYIQYTFLSLCQKKLRKNEQSTNILEVHHFCIIQKWLPTVAGPTKH